MRENDIAAKIVDAAIEVHRQLGPGSLESVYQRCLAYEISERGLKVDVEKVLPVRYKTISFDAGLRLDLHIEDLVIVETKTVETLAPIHTAQLLTYLKLTDNKLGLLLNFKTTLMKHGIQRVVNHL